MDTTALQVSVVGPISPPPYPYILELSGTGDGRLFAFDLFGPKDVFPDSGMREPRVLQLDPATGAILDAKDVIGETGGDFAFAQWGGDFWLFTPAPSTTTPRQRVTRFSWTLGAIVDVTEHDLDGAHVVGAGVSTCAPFKPPK
jgi:hypothetical protein